MNRKMDRKPWSIAILMVLLTGTLLNFVSPFMHMQNSSILAYAKANEDTRNDRMKVDIQPAQVKYNLALEKSAQARSDAIQADKAAQNASEYAQNLINRADMADKKAKAASEPASDGTNGKLNTEGKNSISDQAHLLHIQAQYAIKKAKNLEADAKKLTEAANNAQKETEAARKEVEHLKQNSKSENEGRKTSEGLTPTASGKSKQNGNAKKEGTSIDHTNKKTKDRIDDNLSHKNKELKITNGQKSNQSVQIKESGTEFDDRKAEAVTSLYDKSTNQFNNKATSPRPEPNKMKSTDISNNLLSDSTMNERIENQTFRLKSENITSQQVERDGPDKDGNYFGSSTVGNTPKNENRTNFAQNLEIVTNANIQDLNNTLVYNSTSCDTHSGNSDYIILPDSSSSSNCLASNIFGNSNSSNSTERVSVPAIYRGSPVCDVTLLPINASENNGLVAAKNGLEYTGGCNPNISLSDQHRYLVWSEGDEDGRYILFKRSTDGGKTYGDVLRLSPGVPSAVFNPKVSSEGNNVYVVWQGDSNTGNQDILMRKSEDYGHTFGDIVNLSNDMTGSGNPQLTVNGTSVYVVWDGTTPGSNDVYYRKSTNNGSTFDSQKNISDDSGISYEPKLVVNKHAIEIYWRDYSNGHEDIMMKKSHDGGKTFKIPVKLNADPLDLWKDDRNHFNAQ